MQDNIAYDTVELSNLAPCENVYEIAGTSKTDQKQIEPEVCNSRIQVRCFSLAISFAIALAALAVVLSLVQLANSSSQQQLLNKKIATLRLEVSSVQQNISKFLNMSSNNEPATTIIPTTELASTDTPTTITSGRSETCGGPGWRRVAFINMTDPNQDCPQGLSLTDYSIRSCGRGGPGHDECYSVTFPVDGPQYTHVCGRVTAYRWGGNNGFFGYHVQLQNIDGHYVSAGISLTHGSPQTHIWTFASGRFNGTSGDVRPDLRCPCDPGNTYSSPPFVRNDYFCESVATLDDWNGNEYRFYPNNALWDGQDHLNACYGFNNPPWFNKTLPVPTTDDIELRMCFTSGGSVGNIAVELVEIYIQ